MKSEEVVKVVIKNLISNMDKIKDIIIGKRKVKVTHIKQLSVI